ncbi:Xylose isomerase domain protein TIM barrel [Arcticibacter svalbardensis MN12-7]|uniref:Xylose isomerase domain protein TIM barrel n=1 Tax=Arcticibacter svalbardensis MN12-7 TaxID=1150600 RepID=R9GSP5_9SPHI|nr:TIM barrel protein [Arcticibacter svalbardensis]EOR94887.1 Xylose isomerase domain protein TIM barrel [Arcticibacter svalbardensis MN12-7]
MNRRDFVKQTALSASLIPFWDFSNNIFTLPETDKLEINIFSKQLQFLDYYSLGEIAAEIGFAGVDLTVRPKGHVLPENVRTDLPKAMEAIRKSGSNCKMITTVIESVNNPIDVAILESASAANIPYYRPNWFKYKDGLSMEDSLLSYQKNIKKLGELNKKLGLIGCYQNHAGIDVGSSFWEIKKILETVDPAYFGVQYDVRHSMVEGGNSWINGLKLLHQNIKTIVLKDFKWGKVNGKWEAINVPIGEGMVDFNSYFKLLKGYKVKPLVSLHLEYDLGGAEKGDRTLSVDKKVVFDAMKRDLTEVQRLWQKA